MFVVEESKVGVGAALLAIIVAKLLTPHRTSRPRPINSHNKSRHEGLDGLVLHAQVRDLVFLPRGFIIRPRKSASDVTN
jgi:hypothetical protein